MKSMVRYKLNGERMMTAALTGLLAASLSYAAETEVKPNLWIEGADSSGVSYTMDPSGSIKVQFMAKPSSSYVPPSRLAGNIEAGVGVSAGAFVGDYVTAGVIGLRFDISGDGHVPADAMIILHSASGRDWLCRPVMISDRAGVAVTNQIIFDLSAGWTRNDLPGADKEANFMEDIRNVMSIGIALAPGGADAQYYIVDNFVLYGVGGVITRPAELTPLELALLERFNVKSMDQLSASQRAEDLDGDGMADANEILSEHDLQFANSIFKTEVEDPAAQAGIVLKWACVKGNSYTVLRTKNIMDPFSELPNNKGKDLVAGETGFMKYTDDEAFDEGPFFYRITKKKLK